MSAKTKFMQMIADKASKSSIGPSKDVAAEMTGKGSQKKKSLFGKKKEEKKKSIFSKK